MFAGGRAVKRDIKNIVAFDCGNSSVRVILGTYDGESIKTQVIHQVEHKEIVINGIYYWDILHIFSQLQEGLMLAHRKCGHIDSAGICTWGIDFGMIGYQDQLLSNPICYRNGLGLAPLEKLSTQEKRKMFDDTGIHNHQMNSLYQLLAYRDMFPKQLEATKSLLMIPDLLYYLFTGEKKADRTIASTTQYYSVIDQDYSKPVIDKFDLDATRFAPFVENGEAVGVLREAIAQDLKINQFPFVCVPAHDTASAVAAVPAKEKDFIFLSSGTWGLVGTELESPIVNDKIYDFGLANEQGALNSITLLKNGAGMFIVQRIKKELATLGKNLSWDEIVAMAKSAKDDSLLFDPNNEKLFNPPVMIEAIRQLLTESGQNGDCSVEEIICAFYGSMAMSYRYYADQISEVTGKRYESLYVIGGGSKNMFLNQLIANATGMTVTAGPAEATSIGNILVQLVYHDHDLETLADLRKIVSKSIKTQQFKPQAVCDDKYARFLKIQM